MLKYSAFILIYPIAQAAVSGTFCLFLLSSLFKRHSFAAFCWRMRYPVLSAYITPVQTDPVSVHHHSLLSIVTLTFSISTVSTVHELLEH